MLIVKLFTIYIPTYLFCKIFKKELPYETIASRDRARWKEWSEAQTMDEWLEAQRKHSDGTKTDDHYISYFKYFIKRYGIRTINVRDLAVPYIDDIEQNGTYIYYINKSKLRLPISPNVFEELFPIKPIQIETYND